MIFLLIFRLLPLLTCLCYAKKYENYTLFRGIPLIEEHLQFLQNLSNVYHVNYWRETGSLNKPVEFVIAPGDRDMFLMEAKKRGVYFTTIIEDIQSAFNKQTVQTYIRRRMDTFNWENYYRTDDIYNWLWDLQKTYPKEVKVFEVGKTAQQRKILALSVVQKGTSPKTKVIIEGGIHAREWISVSFVTYMIHEIVHASTSSNKELKNIARHYEFFFVPIVNPDGYEYTHLTDRLWRKNRNGLGIDLNRNFGYGFANEGVSFDKRSDIYCGPNAFSEKESEAMKNFITTKKNGLMYYISFHSYGQYLILPYAHSKEHHENYYEVEEMGQKAVQKIRSLYNTKYTVGTAYDTVGYLVSGASTCWTKKTFNVPYVMTFELRDGGAYGFALPPKQILPTCKETMAGVLSVLDPINSKKAKMLQINEQPNGQGKMVFDINVIVLTCCITLLFD